MLVRAQIKPGARREPEVVVQDDGTLLVYVRAPAIEGKANAAACEVLAKHFGCAKSRVTLVGGATSRHKRFEINT